MSVKKRLNHLLPADMTGGRSYEELRARFLELISSEREPVRVETFDTPDLYDLNRVAYIIPPVTDLSERERWTPGGIYVVKDGSVAIGRVFYTKTSDEYLIEELILNRGDIFGEFEVPLSILGSPALWDARLPPRFNMTYGAWASGPALNWAMAYPRHIHRDEIDRDNARVAVHPFFIKSKNIRPRADAEVFVIPISRFERIVGEHTEAMTWFLMNVLWKTRLYFEPPSEGYGHSPADTVARLLIRILAYRIRLGIVVRGSSGTRTTCRTFIGPTEWIKHGLGQFSSQLVEIARSSGAVSKGSVELDVFPGELAGILRAHYHFPVKDLDDVMLRAMGCTPDIDRTERRYGLITGIRIDLDDLDMFKNYLVEKGE